MSHIVCKGRAARSGGKGQAAMLSFLTNNWTVLCQKTETHL